MNPRLWYCSNKCTNLLHCYQSCLLCPNKDTRLQSIHIRISLWSVSFQWMWWLKDIVSSTFVNGDCHLSVMWAFKALKSPETRLCVEQIIPATIQESSDACFSGPLWGESDRFRPQRANDMESIITSWRMCIELLQSTIASLWVYHHFVY